MSVQMRKVKITKSGGIEMVYDDQREVDDKITKIEHKISSKNEEPHPDLKAALRAFNPIVKYDEGYSAKIEFEVTGITFFPSNDAWVITHVKKKQSGASSTNSGRIYWESEEFDKSDDCANAWKTLEQECLAFLFEGKRAQLSMAFADEAPADEPKKAMEVA